MGLFKLSLVDMIKKIRYNYEYPVDYIDVFISSAYHPGRNVDITLADDLIEARCSGSVDMQFLEKLEKKEILALASVIPPTKAYEKVEMRSRGKCVCIGSDRQVSTGSCDAEEGLSLVIWKMKNEDEGKDEESNSEISEEQKRIKDLYTGSDMHFTLNDEPLPPKRAHDFPFEEAGFRGIISYNPYSRGEINYFANGRRITSEDFLSGIDIYLHRHSLKHTITKSRVLTRRGAGKREYERLQQALPKLLLSYLNSGTIDEIRKESISSYQTILRSVFRKYFGNADITDYVKKNIRFADMTGKINPEYTRDTAARKSCRLLPHEKVLYEEIIGLRLPSKQVNDARVDEYRQYCAELQSMLNLFIQPFEGNEISYDSKRKIMFVPIRLFDEQSLLETGLSVANQIKLHPRKRLAIYRNIVKAYQDW